MYISVIGGGEYELWCICLEYGLVYDFIGLVVDFLLICEDDFIEIFDFCGLFYINILS